MVIPSKLLLPQCKSILSRRWGIRITIDTRTTAAPPPLDRHQRTICARSRNGAHGKKEGVPLPIAGVPAVFLSPRDVPPTQGISPATVSREHRYTIDMGMSAKWRIGITFPQRLVEEINFVIVIDKLFWIFRVRNYYGSLLFEGIPIMGSK